MIADDFSDFTDEFDKEYAKKETKAVPDPLNGYNRLITKFNDNMYEYVLSPVASTYANIVPQKARVGISNFLNNLAFPIRFANNLFQLKLKKSGEEVGKFVVNTIWGFGGLVDLSDELGLGKNDEDFGQTLGYWGVYINPLRSAGTRYIDKYKIPTNTFQDLAIRGFETVNKVSLNLGAYEALKKDALDLYPFLKNVYNQKRRNDIKK
ncbi:MAG: ABC transporter [Arcobacter sp.]|nr:MAG: ABC transporter [Arcobacter sp.]